MFRQLLIWLTNLVFVSYILTKFIAQHLRSRLVGYHRPQTNNQRQLPADCLIEILKHLENDTPALHSCILVNRLWCCLATRILWKRPFEHVYPDNYGSLAIRTYISCLSDEDKLKLINNDVEIPTLKQPFFDYPSYLQGFDCDHFISSVRAWLNGVTIDYPEDELVQLTARLIGNMICRRSPGFRDLRYLREKVPDDMTLVDMLSYNEAIEALSQLQRFEFRNFHNADENFTRAWLNLFTKVSTSTRNLQHITIHISKRNRNTHQELDRSIMDLIRSQNRVQSISLNSFWSATNSLSMYQAISYHSRSLKYLRIQGLSDLPLLFHVLRSCENLRTLEFAWRNGDDHDLGNIRPSTYSLSIKHLYYYFSNGPVDFINTLLQMSNNNLLSFSSKLFTPSIITTIRNHCQNITHLCIRIHPTDLTVFNEQLLNTLQLEHLTIQTPYQPHVSSEQIKQLALALPESCSYFGIDFEISPVDLDLFLCHCNAKLKTLALHNISKYHVKYLEYVIKYALLVGSLKEIKLQRVNHTSDITEYQFKKRLNEQLYFASQRFINYGLHNLKISEVKPISFSYHETIFKTKIINYSTFI